MKNTLSKTSFRIKRYYMYAFATFLTIVVPFITINGNHIFLLSFDKKQLHLMGVAFDMQELYMLPFLLMLLFLGIFAATSIGGRAWCGWACPQTIFRVVYRDLIEGKILGLKRIKNKQKEADYSKNKNKIKKVIGIFLWTILSLLAAADLLWFFVPPEDFFLYLQNPSEHVFLIGLLLGITAFLVYDIVKLKEDFCTYLCPYSRVQSVLYDDNTYQAIYSNKRGGQIYNDKLEKSIFNIKDFASELDECTTCEKCVTVCPTHIDIRKGTQVECINCLECVDACTTVMGKLGKPSLVQWSSTNTIVNNKDTKIIRKTTILYAVALSLILLALIIMGGKKEHMLLNVNKTTMLYKIKENNEVTNNFLLLFQNTQNKKHVFNLEIIDHNEIVIKRFKPFSLAPNKLIKKVLILSTSERLITNYEKDTPISVTIRAYAIDDPENISVLRKAVFIYPRADKLKKD